jgi:hypothetical protein
MIEKMMQKMEAALLDKMGERLVVETDFDEKNLLLTTTSYWDGHQVSENEFDMEPIVDAIVARLS